MEQMEQAEHAFFMKTQKNILMLRVRTPSKSVFLLVPFVPFVLLKRSGALNFNSIKNAFHFFKLQVCNVVANFFFPAYSAVHDFRCAQIFHSGTRF